MARDGSSDSGLPIDRRSQRDLGKGGDERIIGQPNTDLDVSSIGKANLVGEHICIDNAWIDMHQEPRHHRHRAARSRPRASESTDGKQRISKRRTTLADRSNTITAHCSAALMPVQCTPVRDQQGTIILQPVPELDVFDPADPEVAEPPDARVLLGRYRKRCADQRPKHVTRLVLQIGGLAERPLAPMLVIDSGELVECCEVMVPDRNLKFSF